ncbi:30S ribosomal protein S18 [Patescibacteria group bacterium]
MVKKVKRSKSKIKHKNRVCYFTEAGKEPDYKDVLILKRFLTDRQKIMHQSYSGLTAKYQRKLSLEIKKARFMALLPFTDRHEL